MAFDALLLSKFRRPPARPDRVSRAALVAEIEAGREAGRVLTLVSAPAGFGKSTLMREWADTTGAPAVWINIGEEDNDPASFLRYLIGALHEADEAVRRPDAEADPPDLLRGLINDMDRLPTTPVIVLDDYHLISRFDTHDLLAFLLENPPPGLHVVIGTREDPPLPLARMRARARMTEIREQALRFRPEEAGAFLTQTMHLSLSAGAIDALQTRTEGWVTGLQLAGLALRRHDDIDAFVTAFAGDDRYIVDYLMAEVLDQTDERLQRFLRQTSILDRLTAPLCDALTGSDDSQALLEHLEQANLFLSPLDNRREWYRYHGLFAGVLRLTLSEAEQAALHQTAATWYAAHGHADRALAHQRAHDALAAQADLTERPGNQALVEPLTERELEVLDLIAAGYTNADIAERLIIAKGTVKRHISNLYGKLGVSSRTQALAKAREIGLLDWH
ncbi:MAG: AAA family ATPase [Chloroflexi bacterium]|nr:AAA family ATPase [Chloroflexota bacterium]